MRSIIPLPCQIASLVNPAPAERGLGVSLLADQPINHVNCSGNGQLYNGLISPLVNTTIRGRRTPLRSFFVPLHIDMADDVAVHRLVVVSGGELAAIRRWQLPGRNGL